MKTTTNRFEIFQCLLVYTIFFERGLAVIDHTVHDLKVHIALLSGSIQHVLARASMRGMGLTQTHSPAPGSTSWIFLVPGDAQMQSYELATLGLNNYALVKWKKLR